MVMLNNQKRRMIFQIKCLSDVAFVYKAAECLARTFGPFLQTTAGQCGWAGPVGLGEGLEDRALLWAESDG